MDILSFEKQHIKEATALALASYYEERQFVKELPQVCDIPDLNGFAENGLGVAALENENMIGFMCCNEPFDNAFRATDVRGIFSPMGANVLCMQISHVPLPVHGIFHHKKSLITECP